MNVQVMHDEKAEYSGLPVIEHGVCNNIQSQEKLSLEKTLEVVISKWQVIICTFEHYNLLSGGKSVHRSVARVCSEERLGIYSNSRIFGPCFFCVPKEITVSSSFPRTSPFPCSVIFMLNLLTSYADSVIFTLYNLILNKIHKSVFSRPLINQEILSNMCRSLLANVQLFWDENLSIPL